MLEVIICEDSQEIRENMKSSLETFIMMEALDMGVVLASASPQKVLEKVRQEPKTRLYFLDIDLQSDMCGITLGSEIRNFEPQSFIVYVTTHPELTYLNFTYKVGAMDFIVKTKFSLMRDRIHDCAKVAYDRYGMGDERKKKFAVETGGQTKYFDYEDIILFKTDAAEKKIVLYTKNQLLSFTGSLKAVAEMDDSFLRCYKSHVINKRHIVAYDKENRLVTLSNGEVCEVSRTAARLIG